MTEDLSLDELRRALKAQARLGQPVTYAALAQRLGLRERHRIHRLTLALEELLRQDHAAGRPLLAALAVGRAGLPGRGFFLLLSELGRYGGPDSGDAAAAHYGRELATALAYWGGVR